MFFIKDLKALEKGPTRVSIDIKDLKDLRAPLDDRHRGGQVCSLPCATVSAAFLATIARDRSVLSLALR